MPRVTLKDVAKAAEVSVASASNVLNGRAHKVSAQTAERIRSIAAELGYSQNLSAAALKKGTSSTVWVLMPQLEAAQPEQQQLQEHPFFSDFLSGIEKGASLSGLHFCFMRVGRAEDLNPLVNGPRPQGVIVVGLLPVDVERVVAEWDFDTLIVDNARFFTDYSPKSSVVNYQIDDRAMGALGICHLVAQGHRNVVLLFGHLDRSVVHQERYEGIKQFAQAAGIRGIQLTLLETDDSFQGAEAVFPKIRQAMTEGATAVLAMADILAIGCYRAANKAGLRIPEDLSLMGMDNLTLLDYMPYRLTTISQHIVLRGYQAVLHFVQAEQELTKLSPCIVEGETVQPLSA